MTLAAICPPDCENFTGFYPTSNQPSWAAFPALNATIGGTSPFTVAVWVRLMAIQPGYTTIVAATAGGVEYDFFQLAVNSGIDMLLATSGYATFQINDPLRKHWYYLVLTYDGAGNLSFYLDGSPFGTLNTTVNAITNPAFQLGRNAAEPPAGGGNHSVYGQFRNFTVWNACLTADEVMGQMWAKTPTVQTSAVLLSTDLTQSPPVATTGPAPATAYPYFQMEAQGLWPGSPLSPGQATVIDPSGPSPFSLIGWIMPGSPWIPSVSAIPPADLDETTFGLGCLISNRDQNDPQHMAVLLDNNGAVTVQFGTGSSLQTVAATSTPVPQGQWANIAVTYDGATCAIYVNGVQITTGAVTVSTPTSAAAPRLMGRLNGGAPTDVFDGLMQYLSVWNVALTAAQVASLMYSDPTGMTGCVADFSGGERGAQDLSQLGNAIWGANALTASTSPGFWTVGNYSSGVNSTPTTPKPPSEPMGGKIAFKNPQRWRQPVTPTVVPFSQEHVAANLADLITAASAIPSGRARSKLLEGYEEALKKAFADAQAGRLPPSDITVTVDGQLLVVTETATGRVIAAYEVDMSPACAAWWLSFVYGFISGFLTILQLPTPTDKLTAIAKSIINNPDVVTVLSSVQGVTMTGSVMLALLKVVYDAGYLWTIIKAAISSLGWWGAAKVLAEIIEFLQPFPNPHKAIYIANSATAVASLIVTLSKYQGACGDGTCEI